MSPRNNFRPSHLSQGQPQRAYLLSSDWSEFQGRLFFIRCLVNYHQHIYCSTIGPDASLLDSYSAATVALDAGATPPLLCTTAPAPVADARANMPANPLRAATMIRIRRSCAILRLRTMCPIVAGVCGAPVRSARSDTGGRRRLRRHNARDSRRGHLLSPCDQHADYAVGSGCLSRSGFVPPSRSLVSKLPSTSDPSSPIMAISSRSSFFA